MNAKIFWVRDVASFTLNNDIPDTLLVYHSIYIPPSIDNVRYMKFDDFKVQYSELHFNKLILVGLNRIITPQNRCDMVNDFIQTLTRSIPKISIDCSPFIGEPWRTWYHFDVTNSGKFNIPHGYAIETEWKHWFYRDTTECRLSKDNIGMFIDSIYSDLDNLKTSFSLYEVDDDFYPEIKNFSFDKYDSPKLIINSLLRECNSHYGVRIDFDSYRSNTNIKLPNIGIYRFMIEENQRRQGIYNKLVSEGHHESIQ
jgi:hypothetical protein